MYQLLSKLSLGEAPAVLEQEYTMSTTEPEGDQVNDPDDGVINVVRLPPPQFDIGPTVIMSHTLVLQELCSRLQHSLQSNPPSSTILSRQPEVIQPVLFEELALSPLIINNLLEIIRAISISQQATTTGSEGLAATPEDALLADRVWRALGKRLTLASSQPNTGADSHQTNRNGEIEDGG